MLIYELNIGCWISPKNKGELVISKRDKYYFKHLKNNFEKFIHFYEKK